ncbi:MAG: DUF2256 domain-containing protein [Pseudohongiellaceae bacterium]
MKHDGKTLKKSDFPSKVYPLYSLSFSWRKKWKSDWGQVIYCSDGCSRQGVPVEF